ncbi:MAG: SIR2 family protein [Bacteroidales bacterium]|jgi:hypothetical protein|nr:SIR2 family protein [Bacteroidales bacterium]
MPDSKPECTIPQDVKPYLVEIAERLQTRHASVMVGAGFSKNAKGSDKTDKILSWNELADKFFDKLNEGGTSKKEFLNPLKLASEVEAAFGRPTLNNIIRSSIPDNKFQPSELYEKLLNLPWTDVFTTNYDTLLERAAESILQFRYEPVINSEDLIWSTKPRIIKLHGSFPSERPFIITEEDYRTYPSNYAPFVNTVQQSLLENTLCLIGFSGDDPNFLNWIGWIRDNLGAENSPNMYLIGVLSLSNGQRKLLEDRNITPIDISFFSNNHYDALMHFFGFLLKHCQNKEEQNWPNEEDVSLNPNSDNFESQMKETIEVWKKTREEYPNWLIMPNNRRTLLWQSINISSSRLIHYIKNKKERNPFDIIMLYEFNWRLKKSLHPLLRPWADVYRSIVDSYNFDTLNTQNDNKLKGVGNYWIELQLSLLSHYRQEGMDEGWDLLSKRIENINAFLSPEQNAKYHYERCLKQLFSLDIYTLRKELKGWTSNSSLPHWEAKRAGLIAEIGDLEEAQSILETSLKQVRNNLFLNPVKDDYYNISQEAYILQLLDYVQGSIRHFKRIYSNDKREEYRKRWREIIKYECDPWRELELYESSFKSKPPPYKGTEKKYEFNIGRYTVHKKFGNDEYALKAYSFLKFIEETGIPFRLPGITFGKDVATRSLKLIATYSPEWALITFIRTGNEDNMDAFFSRKALVKIRQENADKLSESFLDILEKIPTEFGEGNSFFNRNLAVNLAIILPQILARLSVKNSYKVKVRILNFIKNVYSSEKRNIYDKISILTKSLIEVFSNKEQQQLFSEFLKFPIIPDTHIHKYPDPFAYITFEEATKMEHRVSNDLIDNLLAIKFNEENSDNSEYFISIRKKYLTRLVALWRYNQLNDRQKDKFASLLWEKRGPSGFPIDTIYCEFDFLVFPRPKKIKPTPIQLFEKYIEKSDNWFVSNSTLRNGIEMTHGNSIVIANILRASSEDVSYEWNKERINGLLIKVLNWWENDKKYLLEYEEEPYFFSIVEEFKARFFNMTSLFIRVFMPNINMIDKKHIESINTLLKELPDYKMNDLAARASFLKLFPTDEKNLLYSIEKALLSQNEENMINALGAVTVLAKQSNKRLATIISIISQKIKHRAEKCLSSVISTATIIVKGHKQYLNESIIDDINIGLEYLLAEAEINNEDDIECIHKKLENRIAGIKLVLVLKKYFKTNKLEMPRYVEEWKKRCLDINEFSEIRNAWENNE